MPAAERISVPRGKPLFWRIARSHPLRMPASEGQSNYTSRPFETLSAHLAVVIKPWHQALAPSLGQHHAASVSPGGDLVRRTFLVVSRNRKMRVIVAE